MADFNSVYRENALFSKRRPNRMAFVFLERTIENEQ
jgi:hypothetical protein